MLSSPLSKYCILFTVIVSLSTLPCTYSWSSTPLSSISSTNTQLYSTIDERYYTPATTSHTPNLFDTNTNSDNTSSSSSAGATSEELEIAAQNYGYGSSSNGVQKITLTRWLQAKVQDYPELRDMESLHLSIQMACKTISNLIHSSTTAKLSTNTNTHNNSHSTTTTSATTTTTSTSDTTTTKTSDNTETNNRRDNSMKRLDQISKNILQNALRFTGRLRVVEAPRDGVDRNGENEGPASHQPGVTIAYALDSYGKGGDNDSSTTTNVYQRRTISSRKRKSGGSNVSEALKEKQLAAYANAKWGQTRRLAAFFDPLDGSGNADAAIPTGTVFGVFDADAAFPRGEIPDVRDTASLSRAVLQPGNNLLAAGYCMYSSTTILVFTLGGGTHGFTLDPTINEFVLTHPNMKIPKRGNIYSCNEAYSEGWEDGLKEYLRTIKTGKGETGQRYTQRYIGSMVGDVHRTLMYGGIFCCPSDTEVHHNGNLQLVYKSAPMAYILEHAGGKSTNGVDDLLSVKPERVHQRSPCFMGSPEDMDELMTYMSEEDASE